MPQLLKNSVHEALITGYSSEGAGVCRIGGQVVFVPKAIVGETCLVKILKVGKNAAYGKIEEIASPSEHRIEPVCGVFGKCGGCAMLHADYEEELRFKKQKVEDALHRLGGTALEVEEILGAESREKYRNKVIFAIGEGKNGPEAGFFRNRSHDVVPAENCPVQAPSCANAARAVTAWMKQTGARPYNWQTGGGLIRHVFCRYGFKTKQLQVVVIAAKRQLPNVETLVGNIRKECPEVCSVVLNINNIRGNTVLSGEFETLWGVDRIEDELCSLRFRLSARSFYQVNRDQAERLYEKAVEYASLTGQEAVLDLYCGTGTITLCLARKAKKAYGAEIVAAAIEDAKKNAAENGVENAEFICADASDAAKKFEKDGVCPDVIVVDPPRKGLAPDVVETAAKMAPQRIVYVSCDPATLARDVKLFSRYGYEAKRACAVDMFPGTHHVESVCLLTKR